MKLISKFAITICLALSFNSQAAMITEHDVVFSEQFSTANTVRLNPGLNIIRGTVDYTQHNFYDWFKIELDAWLVISAITWKAENIIPGIVDERIALGFLSLRSLTPEGAGANIFPPTPGLELSFSSIDHADYFDIEHRFFASLSGASMFDYINNAWTLYPQDSGTSSYIWAYSFMVEPAAAVTTPASLGLLSLGLLLLRRRTNQYASIAQN